MHETKCLCMYARADFSAKHVKYLQLSRCRCTLGSSGHSTVGVVASGAHTCPVVMCASWTCTAVETASPAGTNVVASVPVLLPSLTAGSCALVAVAVNAAQ